MQKYKSNITTTSGAAVRGVPVSVLKEDGSPASLFMDRAGTVPAPNPLATGADGTFYFYAVNGRYSIRTTVEGVTITDADVVLLMDPEEITVAGPIADAVALAQDAAQRAEDAVANAGIPILITAAQNAAVDAGQYAAAAGASVTAASLEAAAAGASAAASSDSAAAALASKNAASATLAEIRNHYYGPLASDPVTRPDGSAVQVGDEYQNTATHVRRVYADGAWRDATAAAISLRTDRAILSFPTYAAASAAAATLPDGQTVEVSQDETRAGARTRYKVQSGALDFLTNLDQVRLDLADADDPAKGASMVGNTPAGNIAATTVQGALNELDGEKAKAGANSDITDLTGLLDKQLVNIGTTNTNAGISALTDAGNIGNNTVFGYSAARYLHKTTGEPLRQGVGNTVVGAGALTSVSASCDFTTAIGYQALASNTYGYCNVGVGLRALTANTTGQYNTAIGTDALLANTTASDNTAVGAKSLLGNTTGTLNTGVGSGALYTNTTGSENVAVGVLAAQSSSSASANVAVGFRALELNDSWSRSTAVGWWALRFVKSPSNTAVGAEALLNAGTGASNTAVGDSALRSLGSGGLNTAVGRDSALGITSGSNNTAVGYNSLNAASSGNVSNSTGLGAGAQVSGSNQVQLGDSATTTYSFGPVQNRSDIRDKADVTDSSLGLDFIMGLQAKEGRWDYRDDYPDRISDGSKKRNRKHQWFIAQEVRALCDQMGVEFGGLQNHAVNGGQDVMSLGYDEFIPPIVKALQEIKMAHDNIIKRLSTLESAR